MHHKKKMEHQKKQHNLTWVDLVLLGQYMVGMVRKINPTCTGGEVGIVGCSFTPRRANMAK